MPLAPLKSLQLTLRLLSLAGTHATFLTTLYLTLHPIPFTTLPADNAALLYISLAVLLVLDNAEILALTATPGDGIKRLALYPLVACEAVALVLPMVAAFVEFFVPGDDDYGIGRRADGYGWRREVGRVRWGCVGGVMVIHVVLVAVCCFDAWVRRARRVEEERGRDREADDGWRVWATAVF